MTHEECNRIDDSRVIGIVGALCVPLVLGLGGTPRFLGPVEKLIRRGKGPRAGTSSSSMAFSSSSLAEVDRLARLKKAEFGLVPVRPTPALVVRDKRRRWSPIGKAPGNVGVPLAPDTELLRWKRLLKVAWVMEPRRRDMSAGVGLCLSL